MYIKHELYYTGNNISSTDDDDNCNETRTAIIALTRTPNMQQTDNNDVQTGVFFVRPRSTLFSHLFIFNPYSTFLTFLLF